MNSKIARSQQMTHLIRVVSTVFIICVVMKSAIASRVAVATLKNTDTASFGSEGIPVVEKLSGIIVSSDGEKVPVGDKIPPNCHQVDRCGQCFPCQQTNGDYFCCDA